MHPNVECTQNFIFGVVMRLAPQSYDVPQPYLLLSRGHASADETLLINYVS